MPSKEENETVWKLACFGELEILKIRFDEGESMNEQDDKGFTPLNWAARNGHRDVVAFLMEKGCSVEVPSFGGMKPIHHACNKNLERIVRLLLKKADVNSSDENGDSPLHYAASSMH